MISCGVLWSIEPPTGHVVKKILTKWLKKILEKNSDEVVPKKNSDKVKCSNNHNIFKSYIYFTECRYTCNKYKQDYDFRLKIISLVINI